MHRACLLAFVLLCAPLHALMAANNSLHTLAEDSGFGRTGRYDEVIALCKAFEQRHPDAVRCIDVGTTPQGRPMQALVVSRSGALTADQARQRSLPVLLIQGGIHAGEIDGKDAGFLAIRQLLDGEAAPGALHDMVLVFVPVFNVDGHENFRAWNRPNQRGPEEMGFRVTSQRYNLNRDYVKADAPEMQAMLRLIDQWDPLVMMDLHATDGAQFQHDISITGEPIHAGDADLQRTGRALRDGIIAALRQHGSQPVPFYPSFEVHDDPASGFAHGAAPPRFSHGYFGQRNRFGILVETHSWRTYPERVQSTRNTLIALVELAQRHGRDWLQQTRAADRRSSTLGGTVLPLTWKATDASHPIDFAGYAYTRTPSDVSGALMTRYDESTPQTWRIPLRDTVVPVLQVTLPKAGYLVPPEYAATVQPWLERHGIAFRRLEAAAPQRAVSMFRADTATFARQSMEGHQRLELKGQWFPETAALPAGALFVPIAQPKARLVAQLLEPQAPDSLAAWGLFNTAFEQKEYMEDYVAEAVAREMLAADPALRRRFEEKLRSDPEFAGSPAARLDFFYRLHPAWDRDLNRYPVLRLDTQP